MDMIQAISWKEWTLLALGFTLPIAIKFIQILSVRLTKLRTLSPFIHEWHTYHWSRDDYKPVFREEIWKIERGFLSPLIIATSDKKREDLRYRGKIRFEAGHVVINMHAVKH